MGAHFFSAGLLFVKRLSRQQLNLETKRLLDEHIQEAKEVEIEEIYFSDDEEYLMFKWEIEDEAEADRLQNEYALEELDSRYDSFRDYDDDTFDW